MSRRKALQREEAKRRLLQKNTEVCKTHTFKNAKASWQKTKKEEGASSEVPSVFPRSLVLHFFSFWWYCSLLSRRLINELCISMHNGS